MRDKILEYVNIDTFIEGQTEELRQRFCQQFGEVLPGSYEASLAAFKQALQNNRKWFEDKLVENFPKDIEEDWLAKIIAFNKTQIVQTLRQMDMDLRIWVTNLNMEWLQATPEINDTLRALIGFSEPDPLTSNISESPVEPPAAA